MKQYLLNVDVPQMKRALDLLKPLVPSRCALPILADVLLAYDRERDMFTLTASNGDSWLTLDCAERKQVEGQQEPEVKRYVRLLRDDMKERFSSVCISYADLREAIGALPSQYVLEITLDMEALTMHVNYQIGQFSIPVEQSADFPQPMAVVRKGSPEAQRREELTAKIEALLPNTPKNDAGQPIAGAELTQLYTEQAAIAAPVVRFSIGAARLLDPMKRARICCANDELRPVLNGECLDVSHESVTVVATDGHTLYKDVIQQGFGSGWLEYGEFPVDGSANIVVPKGVLSAITGAFADCATLTLTADSQRIEVTGEGVCLTARAQEGRYPNYNSVIPQNSPYKMVVATAAMRGALRRTQLFANSSSNMAVLRIEGQSFVIETSDYDFAKQGSETVPCQETDAFLPDGFKIGAKISALIGLLDCIQTENAVFFFSEQSAPFLLRNEDARSALTLLQMPMLIQD